MYKPGRRERQTSKCCTSDLNSRMARELLPGVERVAATGEPQGEPDDQHDAQEHDTELNAKQHRREPRQHREARGMREHDQWEQQQGVRGGGEPEGRRVPQWLHPKRGE